MQAFAGEGASLSETTLLQNLQRLAKEVQGLLPNLSVGWQAHGEMRAASGSSGAAGEEQDVWLRLQASTSMPLSCQRCLGPVMVTLEIDQWYRFVASEEIAMAEDDHSEEDLLVMEPQFDLLAVLEDELLMALPLVPMHEQCPVATRISAGETELPEQSAEKPNPFAVLAKLKK